MKAAVTGKWAIGLSVAIAAITIPLIGSNATPVSRLAQELGTRVAGNPAACINPQFTDGPMIVDGRTILFRESGKRTWRADLGDVCPGLDEDSILQIMPSNSTQLCANDRFRVLQRGSRIPGATCRFGAFVPYDKAGKR